MENRIIHMYVYFRNQCKCLLYLVYWSPTEEGHSRGNAKLPILPCQGAFLYSYPEWPSLKVKHQSELLTNLAHNTQKIITSKRPDFRNPSLHQNSTLKMLQCTIKQGKDYQSKRIFYDNGKTLPPAVPCTWEWKGSSNSWPYCSTWLQ